MPMVPRRDNIFWFLLIYVCSKDIPCSLASQDLYTEDIRPSINSEVLTSSAITKSTRPSTTPDGIRSSVVTGCALSSKSPDQMRSSTTEPIWPSINSDKTSSLADTTQPSTKYHVTSPTRPATTLPAPGIVTGSTYLLEGEDLVLTCSLFSQLLGQYTAKNIIFKHSCPSVPHSSPECVPQPSVQVIDEKTAKLNISNVTFSNIGQYTCFAGDTFCQDDVLLGFANDVNIEYTPQNVTDFKCVVYNWDENMNCTWQHPVQYMNLSNIEVTSLYSTTILDPSIKCPNLNNNWCFWGDVVSSATYKVQVVVTNKLKQRTVSTTFTNNAKKNVKPAPIENLTIVPWADKPGRLLISWTHPRVDRSKVYIIKHTEVGDGNFTNLTDNFRNESYISPDYQPYTHHNFSVQCLPAGVYSGYISDPVFKDVWTPMTEPDLGPNATNGSFVSTPCIDGLRYVTLMWQAVKRQAQNGIITGYLITLGQENLTSVQASVFSATVMLSCDSVSVAIFAINEAGLSVSPTILLISTVTVSAEIQSSFVVEFKSTGKVHASWEDKHEVKGGVEYTIFWCKGRLEQSCEDDIQWRELPAGDTEFVVPVVNKNASDYIYGISARNVQTGIASQLFWTPCLFTRHPPKLPTINTMNVKSMVDSVYVTWSADICYYQYQVRYTSFMVKWCRTTLCDEPGQISNDTVPAGESTYTVSSLTAGVNYSFTVLPVSYDTFGSQVDPWKTAVLSATHQENTKLPLAAVLGELASAAVLVILIVVCSRICQRRRNKSKKLVEQPIFYLPTEIVAELGPPLQELRPKAPARHQQKCPAITDVNSPMSLSAESTRHQQQWPVVTDVNSPISLSAESARHQQQWPVVTDVNSPMSLSAESERYIRGISENGYSKLIRQESEVCNNGQDQGSRQSEQDSLADAGCLPQSSLQSSDIAPHARPPSHGYSRFFGSQSTSEVCKNGQEQGSGQSEPGSTTDPGYMPHLGLQSSENTHTRPPSNSYSRVVGNEHQVCKNGQEQGSGQSEPGSTTDPGYMPHLGLQSSENTHTRPPSNSYSRVVGNEHQVCKNGQEQGSGQSEPGSTTDPGYMPHLGLQSSENTHTRPPSNSYSRVVGNEHQVCKNGQEQGSGQSEPGSITDPGYMPHLGFQSSENTHTRPPSNSYSRVVGNEHQVCKNGQEQGSGQSEPGSTTDPGYIPHPGFQSSENTHTRPPSNSYSRVVGNEHQVCKNGQEQGSGQSEPGSTTDPGYIPHPSLQFSENTHTRPPSNSYSRVVGNEHQVCKNGQEQGSGQSEPGSTTDPGYIPHPSLQSSENTHTRPPSHSYSRVVGNEHQVCKNGQEQGSGQSESGSITDPGYIPHPSLQSSENTHTRPPSHSYSRVVGNERQVGNSAEDHASRLSEQESTCIDPGYMSLPSLQSSEKALHKGNGYISGTLPPSTVFTIVSSNSDNSVLYKNAQFENYSEEEETHSRQFSILSCLDLRDGHVNGEVAFADTLVFGDSYRPVIQPATERSTLPDDRTHDTANERLCLGDDHRTAETDPERPAVVLTRIVRAASCSSSVSHTLEGRTSAPAPADINEGQKVSSDESDTDGSGLLQNLHDYSASSIPKRIDGLESGTRRATSDYIQLARLQSSDTDTSA